MSVTRNSKVSPRSAPPGSASIATAFGVKIHAPVAVVMVSVPYRPVTDEVWAAPLPARVPPRTS